MRRKDGWRRLFEVLTLSSYGMRSLNIKFTVKFLLDLRFRKYRRGCIGIFLFVKKPHVRISPSRRGCLLEDTVII